MATTEAATLRPAAAGVVDAPRRTSRARAGVAALSAFCAVVVGARLGGVASPLLRGGAPTNLGGIAPGASKLDYTLTYCDFLEFEGVRAFLKSQGVDKDDWSTFDDLEKYVPREVTFEVAHDKVEGAIGVGALEGYVFTSLVYHYDGAFTASYLVVVDYYGNLVQVSPTYGETMIDKGYTASKGVKDMVYQVLGLKMFNNTHVLLSLGESGGTSGPRALWHWRADAYVTLCGGKTNDAHDIQWAYEEAAVWQVDGTTKVEEASAATGRILDHFAEVRVQDPNHLQATEEDTKFYISSRQTNAIIKMNADGAVEWTLGGEYGDYKIEDYDGTIYRAGEVVWSGQHNAEYFGDDEFCMFDNQEETSNLYAQSRLLCVKLVDDGDSKKGVVTFSYFMGAYTPHFGDNDRLPTGNQLGVHWPYYVETDDEYDVRAVEVERDSGDLAWEMKVLGPKCDAAKRCDHAEVGWYAYSIERVYGAPLLWDLECSDATLSFKTVNNFKQMNEFKGYYSVAAAVTGDDDAASVDGHFDFAAHWRETAVDVDVPAKTSRVQLTVTNQFGDETAAHVDCR
ncbi:voltage-gated potassium channel [Aureococcus anophagefferens]|nr:voltage-gated potassium channel [Aureococcus anophagefferens]